MNATDHRFAEPGQEDTVQTSEAARGFSALPEIVANTATDPDQVRAWLTDVVGAGPDELRREADLPHVRLEWPRGSALLTITGAGAGASWVFLRLTCRGTEDLASRVLDRLADRVDENFTTG
ncbi:hypothetical protein AB0F91_44545 [Amycolatopsis sp. NPDC023774]|uniref:hypothetical protein n=1 Tax=Amycolatopsis sp. NPDC023774 TaxID=3155015 RepID=UPI00340F6094